ncbi:hypothetical protein ACEPAG_3757 [Sanghuangporus baumii]
MSTLQGSNSIAVVSAKEPECVPVLFPLSISTEIDIIGIEVKFKNLRGRKYAVSNHLAIGDNNLYDFGTFQKKSFVGWDVDLKIPSTSTITIVIQEHHTLKRKSIFNASIITDKMIAKPLVPILNEMNEAVIVNIHCEAIGPLVELIRELIEESQDRLAEMKIFLEQYGGVCEGLNLIISIIDPVAEAHPAVKVVVEAVKTLYEACKKQLECHEAATGLMQDIKSFLPFTKIPLERLKGGVTEETAYSLLETFAKASSSIIRYSSQTSLGNLLNDHTDEIDDFKAEFKSLKETFDWCVKTEIWRTVLEIKSDTRSMHLDKLRPVPQSFYDTKKSCFEGTREETLQTIQRWSTSESGLFWLHGAEGSGKTAIAHTIAELLDEQNRLAGCFFCEGHDAACRSSANIIPTIAYQLAKVHEDYFDIVLSVLRGPDERKIHMSLDQQLTLLFRRPLESLSRCLGPERLPPKHRPLIIVLDSPEKCANSDSEWCLLVHHLQNIGQIVPWLKVLISSDYPPQLDLLSGSGNDYQELDISDPYVDMQHDLRVLADFLKYRAERRSSSLGGHHIMEYKATSLSSWFRIALQRSNTWISRCISNMPSDMSGQSRVDEIFRTIIFGVLYVEVYKEEMFPVVRDVLVVVSCLASSRSTIEQALPFVHLIQKSISLDVLDTMITSLSPILLRDRDAGICIVLLPTEFLGFISDMQRSGHLWVDVRALRHKFAQLCLDTMHSDLRLNICDLEITHGANTDVKNLKRRVETNISGILRFSCLNWLDFIIAAGYSRAFCSSLLQILCTEKKLYWLEVLSLIGGLQVGKKILLECASFFKDEDTIVHATTELLDFISVFEPVMTSNPLHIYTSEFVWLPSDSPIRSRIRPRVPKIAFESFPKPASDAVTIDSNTDIFCTARSPDRRRIVSGSRDGRLDIWDGVTGARINIGEGIMGHTDYVNDVGYSPDGSRFVSGSYDMTVKIWDFTGKFVTKMQSDSPVETVAISPNGRRVVSGHQYGILRIWDAQNGDLIAKWQGHGDCVFAVAYSPDGTRIISGSRDNTVRIWDAQNGAAVGEPLKGHEDWILAVAYSPDVSRIVSGSGDATVRIWDAHTGNQIGEPLKGHEKWVVDVGYSQDGSKIISASNADTIRFWNATNGDPVGVLPRGESRWDSEKQHFVSIPHWWPASRWKSFTTQSLVYSSNPLYVPEDGWIRTLDGGLLLWVPPEHRCCSCHATRESTITANDCDERLRTTAWMDIPQGVNWAKMMKVKESD